MRKYIIAGLVGLSVLLTGCNDAQPQLPTPVQEVFDAEGNPVAMPQAGDSGYSGTEMLMMGAAAGLLGNSMGKSSAASKAPVRTIIREKTVIKQAPAQRKPNYTSQPRRPKSTFTSGSTFKSSSRSFSSGRRR